MAFIYKTTNNVNGKIYVGKSKFNNPDYLGSGIKIAYAIKKYGRESFTKIILEECVDSDVNLREAFWISEFDSMNDDIGYNISRGGDGGAHYWDTLTEEERALHNKKISDSKIGKPRKPHTKETKLKQSESFKKHAKNNPEFFKERAIKKQKAYVCVNHATNNLYRTSNLKEFCNEYKLNFGAMQHNARTRKNMCNTSWSCSFDNFNGIMDTDIIAFLLDECDKNNKAYREKISQSRKIK